MRSIILVLIVNCLSACWPEEKTEETPSPEEQDTPQDDPTQDTLPPQDTAVVPADEDGDGFAADEDCDDKDPAIHPNAMEVCDTIDNNCSGLIDDQDPAIEQSSQTM